MELEQHLKFLLNRARSFIPDNEFCGLGVIVYEDLEGLPIVPLCVSADLPIANDLAEQIALCSILSSPCHDGFQFVSKDWRLTKRNQYFAPFPEASKISLGNFVNNVGSRHMAAKLGSLLEPVVCTGVLSDSDGLVVFSNGVAI